MTALLGRRYNTGGELAGRNSADAKTKIYHGGAWWAMACLACCLITLCALFAGLTLGVCGLDIAWLQMKSVTGNEKERQQTCPNLVSMV